MPAIDALNRRLKVYQRQVLQEYQIETLYAYQLGVLTAAHAAHAVSDKWEGVTVIPLADSDEVHVVYMIPHNAELLHPVYLRWILLPNHTTSAATIATTVDKVDMTRNMTGSDVAGDGATALDTTIPAIVAAETGADVPFASDWGIIKGVARGSEYDALFVKLVASGASSADRLRVVAMQVATRRIKHGGGF